MPSCSVRVRALVALLALSAVLLPLISCHGPREQAFLPQSLTWAELRTIRRAVTVKPPNEAERAPYPRERLVDGEAIKVGAEGLAWLRRDGGATLLVRGPASLTVRSSLIELAEGRVFIDTPSGATTEIDTPSGRLHLAHVRASIDASAARTEVYVLSGEVRTGAPGEGPKAAEAAHASAGERLVIEGKAKDARAKVSPVMSWEDWTGGLATTDRTAEPSPFGVGTIGARRPGDQGSPRFPLAIQKLEVRVSIDQDFALTEVDEVFFNPSSEVVEGVYRFRTPDGAALHRFGVDRDGVIKWGRVKEKQAAAAQYQANVYQGSTEDPALLEWDAPGVYRARLYPIGPGETRRVVVTYAEWLGRTGEKGERRLYVYPMAAEGAEDSLPHIEELYASIDLSRAGARDVRSGMAGVRDGARLVIRDHDLVPRADLAVELFDGGLAQHRAYTAKHTLDLATLQPGDRAEALRLARGEADYLLVPIHDAGSAGKAAAPSGGLDLAIVIDTSAATDTASLAIARAATLALLSHLGKEDHVVVWSGDSSLRPVVPGRDKLAPLDEAGRREILSRLAAIERGGATDLGAMLSQAAAALDPKRRGAVVYIGDGSPTVGELNLVDLRDRLSKLPRPVRIFGLGVGDGAEMAILKGLARGAFAERIGDANAAARAVLRLLEAAERPARLGASVDLGPTVERIFPRDLGAFVADESMVVVGRLTGAPPTTMVLNSEAGVSKAQIQVAAIEDHGDLRRRWAEGRLLQMIDEGAGHAAMVDLGSRYGIITPVTSLYVPTKNEMSAEERAELERERIAARGRYTKKKTDKSRNYRPQSGEEDDREQASSQVIADNSNKEGGTGTRAKGEEGSMGRPSRSPSSRRGAKSDEPAAVAAAPPPPPVQAGPMPRGGAAGVMRAPEAPKPADGAPSAAPMAEASAVATPRATDQNGQWKGDDAEKKPAFLPGSGGKLSGAHARAGDGLARRDAIDEAQNNAPVMPRGRTFAPGDPLAGVDIPPPDVSGNNGWMDSGGLGLSGIGEGGGGRSQDIGLGSIGTIGHGAGNGQGFGASNGRLQSELENAKDSRMKNELSKNIETFAAREKTVDKSELKTKGKDDGKPSAGYWQTQITVRIGDVPRVALRCGGAAALPFEERVQLWRERLAKATSNAHAVANVYRRALAWCEAPTWRERSRLFSMMLDAMPRVHGRVALWRVMFNDLGAADSLYRGILARVRTPTEARELHDALGLRSIDPGVLAKLLKDLKTPVERAKKLRALVYEWPDDFSLALKLLDALEDAGDDAGARELGRKLRARPDADARLRTAVGELYLRLGKRAESPAQKALDEAEARRAFGEIVEFAPDDPVARRRLGDLLRAHGLHADAARQYETLARLAPDDPGVSLLLAAAAEGLGRLEEAVKWTEKGGAAGAPDAEQGPARTARAFAATYLSWGRLAAQKAGRADEAKVLGARLVRVLSGERASKEALRGAKVTLTWSHPEFHPTLWTNALGAPMPAPEGDVTLGIAAATVPERSNLYVEVRLESDEVEHAARLGAEAVLTAIFDDGGGERVVRVPITFAKGGPAAKRFSIAGGEVKEVQP